MVMVMVGFRGCGAENYHGYRHRHLHVHVGITGLFDANTLDVRGFPFPFRSGTDGWVFSTAGDPRSDMYVHPSSLRNLLISEANTTDHVNAQSNRPRSEQTNHVQRQHEKHRGTREPPPRTRGKRHRPRQLDREIIPKRVRRVLQLARWREARDPRPGCVHPPAAPPSRDDNANAADT